MTAEQPRFRKTFVNALSGLMGSTCQVRPVDSYRLSQRENSLSLQTTQLAALHNDVTHFADITEIPDSASADDNRRAVLTTLQDEIHQNIQVIAESLQGRGESSRHLKREKIEEMAAAQELADNVALTRGGYLTIAIVRLARIRTVILELGTQQGIQAT